MELNKSMLELNLTDFNKAIIKNLGNRERTLLI